MSNRPVDADPSDPGAGNPIPDWLLEAPREPLGDGGDKWIVRDGESAWVVHAPTTGGTPPQEERRCATARERIHGTAASDGAVIPIPGPDGTHYVRPYLRGRSLSDIVQGGPMDLMAWLDLAAGAAKHLAELHATETLHLRIRPSNLIVASPGAEGVHLVDTAFPEPMPAPESTAAAIVARSMAPEQAGLTAQPLGPTTDLFGLGLTLYEALTGAPLYDGLTLRDVLSQQATVRPRPWTGSDHPTPMAVHSILTRLLAKEPGQRYQTAHGLHADLVALQDALRAGEEDPEIPIGAQDTRTTLTEPVFVGRREELNELREAVHAIHERSGLALLEGESGGGKSRLLEEVRQLAETAGMTVYHGQGIDHGAQQPYQVLAGVAASLERMSQGDPERFHAVASRCQDWHAAISEAFPILDEALGSPRSTTASASEQAHERVLSALESLLRALGDPKHPTLVILDDLQWADEGSLQALERWARRPGDHVLIIGAMRTEEVGPEHRLRSMTAIDHTTLAPLTGGEVRALAWSMAGPLPREATQRITRLSGGSPFMAAAMVHGLVEVGALHAGHAGWELDHATLDDVTASEEAAGVLAQRFRLLPEEHLRVLSTGAVVGKRFDARFVSHLAGVSDAETEEILEAALDRRIVWTESPGRFMFAHDKLRETLLGMLDAEQKRHMHERAASRLRSDHDTQAFELAYHYKEAGDVASAFPFALQAADQARARYSLEVAHRNYLIALEGADPSDEKLHLRLHEALGDVLLLRGQYDDAGAAFQAAEAFTRTDKERARLLFKSGERLFKQGDVHHANLNMEAALALLGRRVPRSDAGYALRALKAMVRQVGHHLAPKRIGRRPAESGPDDIFASQIFSKLAHGYWFERGRFPCLWAHLEGLNLAELYTPTLQRVTAYAEHGPVMTMVPYFARGRAYTGRAVEMARELDDPWGEGQSECYAAVVHYAASDYERAVRHGERAVRLLERTGDPWQANVSAWNVAMAEYRLGRLDQATTRTQAVLERAREIGDAQTEAICLGILAKTTQGRVPLSAFDEAERLDLEDQHAQAELRTGRAIVLMNTGRAHEAIGVLEEAWSAIRARGLKQEYVAPVPAWTATAIRKCLETISPYDRKSRRRGLRRLGRATRTAMKTARTYQNNLPHALRERALFLFLKGQDATDLLERAITVATDQGALHEVALTQATMERLGGVAPETAVQGPSALKTPNAPMEPASVAPTRAAAQATGALTDAALPSGGCGADAPTFASMDRFDSLLDAARRISRAEGTEAYPVLAALAKQMLRGDTVVVVRPGDSHEPLGGDAEASPFLPLIEAAAHQGALDLTTWEATSQAAREHGDGSLPTQERPSHKGRRPATALAVPITVQGEVDACLYVGHASMAHLFGPTELRIASFLASIAGATIESHEALDEVQSAHGAIARQHDLLERMQDSSRDGILVIDMEGRVVTANARFRELWGLSPESVQAGSDAALIAEVADQLEDPEAFMERIGYLYEHPYEESEEELRFLDGRIYERHSAGLFAAGGAPHGRVWFFHDVTEERRNGERLQRAYEDLQKLDALKNAFVNNAAHELNTPLTPIRLQLGILRSAVGKTSLPAPYDGVVAGSLEVLGRNFDRLAGLALDILDSARVQSHTVHLRPSPVDLGQMVSRAAETFSPMASEKGLDLTVDAPTELHGFVDGRRVEQVMYNLISNAVKYTDRGEVHVRLAQDDDHAVLTVRDSGLGLSKDQIEQLFQPFAQVHDTVSEAEQGTGLGLFVCKGLIEAHGGSLHCRSDGPQKGAVFTARMPLQVADDTAAGA